MQKPMVILTKIWNQLVIFGKLKNLEYELTAWYESQRNRLTIICICGIFSLISFYFYWIEQGEIYENLTYRILGSIFLLGLAFHRQFPKKFHRFRPWYFFGACTFCIPSFMIFMTLGNRFSTNWSMSLLSGIFLIIAWAPVRVAAYSL